MSPSCNVSLKVEFRQPTESTFHRFSGVYTFATLRSAINALVEEGSDSGNASSSRYVIEYTDEDKDQIRLTSEAEWEECLRVFEAAKTPLLRLVVSDPTQKRQSDPRRTSQPKNPFTPFLDSLFGRGCAATSSSSTKAPGHQDPCAFLEAVLGGVAGPNAAPGGGCCGAKKNHGETSSPKHDITSAAAMDLLSLIYGCDARAELERGDISTPALRRGLSRVFNPFTGGVRLTLDSATLYGDAVTKGNSLIESHDLGEAEHVLRLAIEVFAKSAILYYNLACVLSLQGRLDEAIDVLLVAKSHGYNDVQHLQQDPDLENARDHPRFVELVAQESEKKQNDDGVLSPASTTTSSAASSSSEDVVALLGMFPEMSAEEATHALTRASGDVARAVNGRLAGYW